MRVCMCMDMRSFLIYLCLRVRVCVCVCVCVFGSRALMSLGFFSRLRAITNMYTPAYYPYSRKRARKHNAKSSASYLSRSHTLAHTRRNCQCGWTPVSQAPSSRRPCPHVVCGVSTAAFGRCSNSQIKETFFFRFSFALLFTEIWGLDSLL